MASVSGKLDDMEFRLKQLPLKCDKPSESKLLDEIDIYKKEIIALQHLVQKNEPIMDGSGVNDVLSRLVASAKNKESLEMNQILQQLGIDSDFETKAKYINELKSRNTLLVNISQQFDKMLGISTSNITTFSKLRQKLVEKTKTLIERMKTLQQEKEFNLVNCLAFGMKNRRNSKTKLRNHH
jgi:hypothetical protein